MLVNGSFFVVTTCTIYRSNLNTATARDSRQVASCQQSGGVDRVTSDTREQLLLYTKLFIVMGVHNSSVVWTTTELS